MKNPRNILITGASSGIGEALALHYAAKDVQLYLTGRDQERLEGIVSRCETKGAVVNGRTLDVVDKEAMAQWISGLVPLDLVIANAGISGGSGGVMNGEPINQARKIFDVNLMGVLNTIEPSLEAMLAGNHKGQIALVSSLSGFRGWPSAPAYSASKGAVRFYGEAMRGVLKDSGIQVNVICPGFVKSRITDANEFSMPMLMTADKAAEIIARGLAKNKGRICFPLPVHFCSWLIGTLPDGLAQIILSKAPQKGLRQD